MGEREKVKLAKSIIPYWRGKSVPPPIIRILKNAVNSRKDALASARDIAKEVGFNSLRMEGWIVKCPYCGHRFEVVDNKVIRCPRCNNVIKKVNFEVWNSLLEKYVNYEVTEAELNDSPVIPTDDQFELMKEPDIAFFSKTNFKVSKYGFDKIFKFFSPTQIRIITTLISKIRETKGDVRVLLSLALLDYLSYNSMFTDVGKKIRSMFHYLQPKVSWKWVILPPSYFIDSLNAVLRAEDGVYVPSLNLALQEEIYNFYLQFLKSSLSDFSEGVLTPNLYPEYFFECLDEKCNAFVEIGRHKISLEDLTGGKTSFMLKTISEDDINTLLNSEYRVLSIKYERDAFRIQVDKNRSEKIALLLDIHARLRDNKIEGKDVEALANALEVVLREFTSYKKIVGMKGVTDVFNEVANVLCNSINCNVSDKMAKYYIIGKYYGKSKRFFRMLYMISNGTKVKFNENSNNVLGLLAKVRRDPTIVMKIPPAKVHELIQIIRILSNTDSTYKELLSKVKEEIEINSKI